LTTDDIVSPASNNPFLAQNGGEVVSPPLSASSQPPTAASLDSLSGANSSSAPFSANSHSSGLSGSSGPQSATSNLSQSSKDTASSAADKANNASAQAKDTANTAAAKAKDVANNASAQAKDVANNASAQAKSTANAASNKANDIATGLRQRVNNLPSLDEVSHNPTVQNVKGAAGKQVGQLREQLGRSKFIRDLEKRTNIDRVYLVVGGILA
jgi:F0F1-type ATP synthase membrane subunit b/b'